MNYSKSSKQHLLELAKSALVERGLEPAFSNAALQELEEIDHPAQEPEKALPDLTELLWCSIDNDDSMDLDQISVCLESGPETIKVLIGVADVDAIVKKGSPIDLHAQKNTTSIYTQVKIFPLLPTKLSYDLTSLSPGEDRLAMVTEMELYHSGELKDSKIYRARVRNHAKLAYNSVAAWLDGEGPLPEAAKRVKGMDQQLRDQDRIAQKMRKLRYQHGALDLETIQTHVVLDKDKVVAINYESKNRAKELIEDFMVAVNGVTARFLSEVGFPSLRRLVRIPEHWDRIVQVAAEYGDKLPVEPNGHALADFLSRQREVDPVSFPDLSLTIVKLLGRGEYVVESPQQKSPGHFGLAVRDYTHSTAPNRRYPDLITQRLLKAALTEEACPYSFEELKSLGLHCTSQENAADKVERQISKSASASLLASSIGEKFKGIVTGCSRKGSWVRIFRPPAEGRIVKGQHGLQVGDRVLVKLVEVDVDRGYIDFARTGR